MKPPLVLAFLAGVLVCRLPALAASGDSTKTAGQRYVIWTGLGVGYIHAAEIVSTVNATPGAVEGVGTFKAGAEFSGAVIAPLSPRWAVKVEYCYLLMSYTVASGIGTSAAEYTVSGHMPTVTALYTLLDDRYFCLRGGVGGGYLSGKFESDFFTVHDTYTGSGFTAKVELEGLTAVGENLFAMLGGELRWGSTGALKNLAGFGPSRLESVSLKMFAPAARIGIAYVL